MTNEQITDADRAAAKAIVDGLVLPYRGDTSEDMRQSLIDDAAQTISNNRAEREERLIEVIELYQTIAHLRRTCVVCDCALVDDANELPVPFCATSCLMDDQHEDDWRAAMHDHHRMLDEALSLLFPSQCPQ